MTTKVTITNRSDINYGDKHNIEVVQRSRDPENKTETKHLVLPGNEVEIYIWNDNEVVIRETFVHAD